MSLKGIIMKTIKFLAATAILCAAGSAFASYDDGQPDNAWLMQPAASQVAQTPAPAPTAAASQEKSTIVSRPAVDERDVQLP
jgi:hypothetical protein